MKNRDKISKSITNLTLTFHTFLKGIILILRSTEGERENALKFSSAKLENRNENKVFGRNLANFYVSQISTLVFIFWLVYNNFHTRGKGSFQALNDLYRTKI